MGNRNPSRRKGKQKIRLSVAPQRNSVGAESEKYQGNEAQCDSGEDRQKDMEVLYRVLTGREWGDRKPKHADSQSGLYAYLTETLSHKKGSLNSHEDLIIQKVERITEDAGEILYHIKKIEHRNKRLLNGDRHEESTVFTRIGKELCQDLSDICMTLKMNFTYLQKHMKDAKFWKEKPGKP